MTKSGDSKIGWIAHLRIPHAQQEQFLDLTNAMIHHYREEEGLLPYVRILNLAEEEVIILEQYRNAEAAIRHLEDFKIHFRAAFEPLVYRKQFTVYGAVPARLRQVFQTIRVDYREALMV